MNHLHFKEPVDATIFAASERDLLPEMRAIEGFRGYEVVQTSERDVILVIIGDSVADKLPVKVIRIIPPSYLPRLALLSGRSLRPYRNMAGQY